MNRWQLVALSGLIGYSASMILVERRGGQEAVRWYLTDIDSQGAFFGINTTLCTGLMAGTALVFALAMRLTELGRSDRSSRTFYGLQAVLFAYLALDERLLIHESLGSSLGLGDAYIILALGVAEVVVLVVWAELPRRGPRTWSWLAGAAGFFSLMVFADGVLPSRMPYRLSVEDLSKTWAAGCLFSFALESYLGEVRRIAGMGAATGPVGQGWDR